MKLKGGNSFDGAGQNLERGFTRLDLIVVIVVVLFVATWFGYAHLGERGRISRCTENLAALGKAMQGYVKEHGEALPAAGVNLGNVQNSWDMQIFSYLKPGLAKANDAKLAEIVPRFFVCPSDQVSHQGPVRSYAMGGNDMTPENWPPGRDSATGVGLWWDKRTVLALLDEDALKTPETLPTVKLSNIPAPADTVLLTEFIDPNNAMGSIQQTSVFGTSQQRRIFKDGGAKFHRGKFDYLMVDGHVESLSPLQTGAFDGTAGIWSLKKEN